MMHNSKLLPNRLTKEEVAAATMSWTRILSTYSSRRKKALKEPIPGYNTLWAMLMAAIAKHDRSAIEMAAELTKENMPQHIYLSLLGSAWCELGNREKGLAMLREAAEIHSSPSLLLSVAGETDDLEEKQNLAGRVLADNPQDVDALRHLAYAKYHQGDREEAERLIDKILLTEANNILALEYKGNIYFDAGEYGTALEQYRKIALKPMPLALRFKICHCYYLLGQFGKARKIAKSIRDKVALANYLEADVQSVNELLTKILNS